MLEKTPKVLKHVYTLIVVFVGWGLFAMVDLSVCGDYLAACFGNAPLWSAADGFRLRSYAVTLAALVLASTALGRRLWAKLPRRAEALFTPVLMGAFPGGVHRLSGGRQLQPLPVFPVLRGGRSYVKSDTQDFSPPCSASSWGD